MTTGNLLTISVPPNTNIWDTYISMDAIRPDGPLKYDPDEHFLCNPFIESVRLTDEKSNLLKEIKSKKAREDEIKEHGFILQDDDCKWGYVRGTGTPFFEVQNQKEKIREEVKPALEMLRKSYELWEQVRNKFEDFDELFEYDEEFLHYFRNAATDHNPLRP